MADYDFCFISMCFDAETAVKVISWFFCLTVVSASKTAWTHSCRGTVYGEKNNDSLSWGSNKYFFLACLIVAIIKTTRGEVEVRNLHSYFVVR